jgi:predicted PurR-regulated permease PerM
MAVEGDKGGGWGVMRSLRNRIAGPANDDGSGPELAADDASVPETAAAAVQAPAARGADSVPPWLRVAAAWSWRLLLIAIVIYLLARLASLLYIVVVPCAAAMLVTALLQPLVSRLKRAGLAPLAATWCVMLLAFALLAGAVTLVTTRVQSEYPSLVSQVKHVTTQVQSWLAGRPFHLHTGNLTKLSTDITKYLSQHRSLVEGTVLTGGKLVFEFLAGLVLTFFVSFFLVKDGDRIWTWLTHRMADQRRRRADIAGHAAWQSVVQYVRGTVTVAAIHSIVMGITLSVMNVPLAAALALLMFLAAFVPLVGVLVAGTLAVIVTLATKGLIDAIIVLCVLIAMNQAEGHLLQPLVVGRMVRLHPLAVILVLAIGTVVAGIAGGVVAVPITAAITSAVRALHDEGPPVV